MIDYSNEIWAVLESYLTVETRRGNPYDTEGRRIVGTNIIYISGIDRCVEQLNKLMNAKHRR